MPDHTLVSPLHPRSPRKFLLTPAERAVVDLVVAGCANQEIAAFRGSTESTVKHQLVSAYRKLGVHSRSRLMALIFTSRTA